VSTFLAIPSTGPMASGLHDRRPQVAARHHMVQRACKHDSKRTGHRAMLAGARECVNTRPDP